MAQPGRAGRAGGWAGMALAAMIGLAVGAGVVALFSGHFVRSYLLQNPEVIPEAMQRLQQRQASAVVDRHREALETPFHGAWAGAEDGDVVLVAFFDYACGYCRASNADIDRLLAGDPRLKVVWRELPVLGPDSRQAALVSLSAARQGRFRQFYERLFARGRPTPDAVASVRGELDLPPAEASPEFEQELERNFGLAEAVGASGTPTFVVGSRILHGAVGYEALSEAVAAARAGG